MASFDVVDSVTGLSSVATMNIEAAAPGVEAPTATLDVTPSSGVAPLTTSLQVGGSDPGGLPLTYSLDFGDGRAVASGALAGAAPIDHTYASPGSYAAVLHVSNGQLGATTVVHIQVDPATPLVANAGDSQVVTVNDDVHFDGSGSQPASAIQSYAWDFGDGSTGSGVNPDHVYTAPGTYTATLKVTSATDSQSSSATIAVNPVHTNTGLTISVTSGGSPLSGAEAMVIQGNGQRVSGTTDASGNVNLAGLPDGSYTVYVYQTGYLPAAVTAVITNGVGAASVDLSSGPTANATVTSTRLTYSQIIAAGINPNDPANENVFKFTINLPFVGVGAFTGYVCGDSFCGDTGYSEGGSIPAPIVTSVVPGSGSSCGGTTVTITGVNLSGAGRVLFGGVPAGFTVNSDSSITATAPGGSDGIVDVTVTTGGGVSVITRPISSPSRDLPKRWTRWLGKPIYVLHDVVLHPDGEHRGQRTDRPVAGDSR